MRILLFLISVSVLGCQSPRNPERSVSNVILKEEKPPTPVEQGPIDDCLFNSYLYARVDDLVSECTLNYVHFYPSRPAPTASSATLELASFNLFHLGDNQAPMKDFKLMAKVMNQWDLIGVQEMMPLPKSSAEDNRDIYEIIYLGDSQVSLPYDRWEVIRPGYLELLLQLRKFDPGWALILQSQPEGEGSSGEMAGFYYRSSLVQPKAWDYCDSSRSIDLKTQRPSRNLACLARIPPAQRKLMSRGAFAAYFESGNLDFVALSAHVRFRPSQNAEDLEQQMSELCAHHSEPEKCKVSKEDVGRFYEVKAIADQVPLIISAANDRDVIYMGDFNLEVTDRSRPLWKAALNKAKGLDAFQLDATTLSVKKNILASNYDHFVFDPQVTTKCDADSIRSFDFTKAEQKSAVIHASFSPDTDVLADIRNALKPDAIERLLSEKHETLLNLVKPDRRLRPPQIVELSEKDRQSIRSRFERAAERIRGGGHGALLELLSDHLPVHMLCHTR